MKFDPLNVSESQECDAFCEWANLYPKIGQYLISIPNQALCYTNPGIRKKLTRQGVKKGIPDYFLAIPANKHSGLFIEMKVKKNVPTDNQMEWLNLLKKNGYSVFICYSWIEAAKVICQYLNLPREIILED